MRRLVPDSADERLEDLYLDLSFPEAPPDRPYLYLDMVSSVDGAATLEGRTAGLGGEADALAFSRLREWCDAVLVGASTVRIENYGPARPKEDSRRRRLERGLVEVPPIIVVTATASFDPGLRIFGDPDRKPIILTAESAPRERLDALRDLAHLHTVGSSGVDLREAMKRLRADGVARILGEGGPTLNSHLLNEGLVDELFLTIPPQVVGFSQYRIVEGHLTGAPRTVELLEAREHAGELLLRYRFV